MKKLLWLSTLCLALLGLEVGCIVETSDAVIQKDAEEAPSVPINDEVKNWNAGSPTSPGPWGGGPCGYQTYVFSMSDGTETVLVLPLECDPFWFNTGHSPPESNPVDEQVQPPIDESVLHEEQQFSY